MYEIPEIVGKNYKVLRKIQQGGFGKVYEGINTKTNIQVAIKFEQAWTYDQQLRYEFKLYKHLHSDPTVMDKGIPNVYYLQQQDKYNALVMDLMGPSLQTLLYQSGRKFSLKTVLMLIDQIIARIQFVHNIKPDNLCIGLKKLAHRLFLMDFGLAKRWRNSSDKKHRAYCEGKGVVGTVRYASLNMHQGIQQSRRDDMESIGYVAIYFLRGMLPWQGLKANDKKQRNQLIKKIDVLCKGIPVQFAKYITYCRNLKYQQSPQYSQMRKMFKDLFNRLEYKYDYIYDWVDLHQKRENIEKKQYEVGCEDIEKKEEECKE